MRQGKKPRESSPKHSNTEFDDWRKAKQVVVVVVVVFVDGRGISEVRLARPGVLDD